MFHKKTFYLINEIFYKQGIFSQKFFKENFSQKKEGFYKRKSFLDQGSLPQSRKCSVNKDFSQSKKFSANEDQKGIEKPIF